ncbi:MAG: insulinase family protein [Acidobacteriota bacterium]|nr:insulinase family protein [Acidobacteriota bacterium]
MRLLFQPDDPRVRAVERPPKISTKIEALRRARDTLLRLPGRVVGFAGAITAEDARAAARRLLPPLLEEPPEGVEPTYLPAAPRTGRPARVRVRLPRLTQVYFALTRESLTDDDPRYPALMLADHALGGYFFSRLYRALRHEGGETYGARSSGLGGVVSTGYALGTFTRTANADHTERKLRRVLEQFHHDGISEDERSLAAAALRGRRLRRVQDPARRLAEAMDDLRHNRRPGFRDRLVEAAARVSLEQVNQVIEEFYDPDDFTMVRVEPR